MKHFIENDILKMFSLPFFFFGVFSFPILIVSSEYKEAKGREEKKKN